MKKLLSLLILTLSINASAGTFSRYGLGVLGSATYGLTSTKIISLGYVGELLGPFLEQFEAGLYVDSSGYGRKNSGFGFYSVGTEVNPGYLVLRSFWGLGLISKTDSMLGGHFQFSQDFLIGLRDDRQRMIGLVYKHISSAGLAFPNKGRDFATLQVEIPW